MPLRLHRWALGPLVALLSVLRGRRDAGEEEVGVKIRPMILLTLEQFYANTSFFFFRTVEASTPADEESCAEVAREERRVCLLQPC